ncbi:SpoIIE family protein phosphatase [Rhodoplanes serenus]|uniref:SpoIIE family protein phosphatase n=1 Tax=Rhodoplanes serenus TaxID=200615 RepID=A0A9X4XS57_9BRAD|nr:ATP-binding SpoIIE family protein phosphatase [Rhodoplanes serenus]MTW18824.1 SpoIIE family protein phosphatase [Rhodoplanes serenus]
MIRVSVSEQSQIAEARRTASERAERHGFGTVDVGRVALATTELATNLIKHAGGGEILVGAFEEEDGTGIEVLSLDKGRGIADLASCLEDGYSTSGTNGHGLGAVVRQAHMVEVATWPGLGTALLARFEPGTPPKANKPSRAGWGAVSVAKEGEAVCGDAFGVIDGHGLRTLMVADGLGHGPEAADAATQAVRVFNRHKDHRVPTMLDYIHGGLRATRGAAVSVARLAAADGRVEFGGIGNVAGVVVTPRDVRRMISLPGTAGHAVRKIQSFDYRLDDGVAILHSDGLATSWSLDRYPGLIHAHPTLIAAVLFRDFWRRRDDVTVLVAGAGPNR